MRADVLLKRSPIALLRRDGAFHDVFEGMGSPANRVEGAYAPLCHGNYARQDTSRSFKRFGELCGMPEVVASITFIE